MGRRAPWHVLLVLRVCTAPCLHPTAGDWLAHCAVAEDCTTEPQFCECCELHRERTAYDEACAAICAGRRRGPIASCPGTSMAPPASLRPHSLPPGRSGRSHRSPSLPLSPLAVLGVASRGSQARPNEASAADQRHARRGAFD